MQLYCALSIYEHPWSQLVANCAVYMHICWISSDFDRNFKAISVPLRTADNSCGLLRDVERINTPSGAL